MGTRMSLTKWNAYTAKPNANTASRWPRRAIVVDRTLLPGRDPVTAAGSRSGRQFGFMSTYSLRVATASREPQGHISQPRGARTLSAEQLGGQEPG